jgi:hypothetical protein
MAVDFEGIHREYHEIQETEATSEGTILGLLAGGKPYAFIVPSIEGDNNEKLVLKLSTNIPSGETHILRTVLEGVLSTLPKPDNEEFNYDE